MTQLRDVYHDEYAQDDDDFYSDISEDDDKSTNVYPSTFNVLGRNLDEQHP
jgi:hypothetical protein